MTSCRRLALSYAFVWFLTVPAIGADWPPISAEELTMTSEPLAPEAPAIYLLRQVDRDDAAGHEYTYVRIKVLKDQGRIMQMSRFNM
jgi:hypothetical protein